MERASSLASGLSRHLEPSDGPETNSRLRFAWLPAAKAEIDAAVKAAIAAAYCPGVAVLEKASGLITDAINWLIDTGDDLIQTQTVVNPRSMLEWYAGRTVNIYVDHNKSTSLPYHFTATHHGGGATYYRRLRRHP